MDANQWEKHHWKRLKDLFAKALNLTDVRRRAFIAKARAKDGVLGQRLQNLLALHEKAGGFLDGGNTSEVDVPVPRELVASRYKLIRPLGHGGMGEVYQAKDQRLDRDVAVKLLPQHLVKQPDAVTRFIREARAASALNHPNIVTIYDAGKTRDARFIVMEYIPGRTIRQLIGQPPSNRTFLHLAIQMAKALVAAHAADIIHRDVKPENMMLRDDGYLKMLDFGLARWDSGQMKSRPSQMTTAPNLILGTLPYLSPEILRRQSARPASDIFSLGIVLYELATGKHPFEAESTAEILHAIEFRAAVPPSRLMHDLDPALESIILLMLQKDYHGRPTALEVEHVLSSTFDSKSYSGLPAVARTQRRMVGRQRELKELHDCFEEVVHGRGFLVSIAGEAGIGKTTLVADFLDDVIAGFQNCVIGRGRSSERLARTEAYLPFLGILEDMLKRDNDGSIVRLMRELAPDWYAQAASEMTIDGNRPADAKPAPRERLKRQISHFLEKVSKERPVILFFDDIHWADASTVDLLSYLALRFDSIRVLVLATYRPQELLQTEHPFGQVKGELEERNQSHDVQLDFLTLEDVAAYLKLEFHVHDFPAALCELVYSKSEGNPLFMVEMVRYLRERKILAEQHGTWSLVQPLSGIRINWPKKIEGMIQRKIGLLKDSDRQLLAAASIQGYEFDSAVVARALKRDPAGVEEHLNSLHQVHAFVRLVREQEFPDGRLTLRYRFVHSRYQDVFFASVMQERKKRLSAAIAQALLKFHGDQHAHISSGLAALFEAARKFSKAADYFLLAARNAAGVFAYEEAALLARRALAVLEKVPDGSKRAELELEAQLKLGESLLNIKGYGNKEVKDIYDRARELCLRARENPQLFPVLWGLYLFYVARLELEPARELAEQLFYLAYQTADRDQQLSANFATGIVDFLRGNLTPSLDHFKQYRSLDDAEQRMLRSQFYGLEVGILLRGFEARVLWFMGFPDRSLAGVHECLKLARELNHPPTLAFVMAFAALVHQMRGEVSETLEIAEKLVDSGTQHGLVLWIAEGSFFKGWVQTQRNEVADGLETMRQSLAGYCATGTQVLRPYFHAVLAETLGECGKPGEGLALLGEVPDFGATYYDADLRRIEGLLLFAECKGNGETRPRHTEEAKSRVRQSLRIAGLQGAKSFELRAAMALKKLSETKRESAEAHDALDDVYRWFTEGEETADLREARNLLGIRKRAARAKS